MDETNHHLWKPVFTGEIKADGQFNVVWKTKGSADLIGLRNFRLNAINSLRCVFDAKKELISASQGSDPRPAVEPVHRRQREQERRTGRQMIRPVCQSQSTGASAPVFRYPARWPGITLSAGSATARTRDGACRGTGRTPLWCSPCASPARRQHFPAAFAGCRRCTEYARNRPPVRAS